MYEEEKQVVQRWLGYLQGDPEEVWSGFEAVMAPDIEWVVPGKTPVSGSHRGLKALNDDFFAKCWETGDGRGGGVQGLDGEVGLEMKVEQVVGLEDGRVLVTCHSTAVGRNGVPYDQEYCWIITVRDGKIAHLREYCDTVMFETAMFDKRVVPAEQLQSA
jgi:ketosteroid isomerase-like protein